MHHFFKAFEVAVVHVGFDKAGRGTHVYIAQSGYLKLRVKLRRDFDPLRIGIELATVALQRSQEGSDPLVDVRRSGDVGSDVGSVASLVRPTLVIELQSWISG